MNEEEKQAVEKMQYILDLINKNGQYTADEKDIKHLIVITNLIIKYQKEIEELKERNQTCIKESDLMNAVFFLMNRNDMSNYISKDKIKGLIQEIESYAYTSLEEKEKQDYAIYELKRLLEE